MEEEKETNLDDIFVLTVIVVILIILGTVFGW